MITQIIKTDKFQLQHIIQYFIFFKAEDHTRVSYTTFPNTNVSLFSCPKIKYKRIFSFPIVQRLNRTNP